MNNRQKEDIILLFMALILVILAYLMARYLQAGYRQIVDGSSYAYRNNCYWENTKAKVDRHG